MSQVPACSSTTPATSCASGVVRCSAAEAQARLVAGTAYAIDVRTPAEHRAVHADGVTLIPLDQFNASAVAAAVPTGKTVHLLCKSGGRATMAAQKLLAAGCPCVVVEGGTDAWVAAGLPVQRGKAAMALERQVRIAAGALVLTGVILGFTVAPGWFGLAGFVGAGLIFAGVTDTCMMGMLIAKCPWNR